MTRTAAAGEPERRLPPVITPAGTAPAQPADLGVPVDAAEARATTVTVSALGARVNICFRGALLAVDPETAQCRQIDLPDAGFPFAAISTTDGRTVTGGSWFGAETDPASRQASWIAEIEPVHGDVRAHRVCPGEQVIGLGLGEAADGAVWFTTYPGALLVRWDRSADTFAEPVRLSETEEYPTHVAVDRDGWVYVGIGTTTRSVVALGPDATEAAVILHSPQPGCGYVRLGADGIVYGHIDSPHLHPEPDLQARWYRFDSGVPVPVAEPAPGAVTGTGFDRIHQVNPAPWTVVEVDLPHRRLVTSHPRSRVTPLTYRSSGAELSAFRLGPTGRLHGTSNHPLQLFDADPATGHAVLHGLSPVAEAGGNICAWSVWGELMAGVAYTGGHLYLLDPAAPVAAGTNPRHLGAHPEAGRPRCCLVVGDTLVWSGYGDYGHSGGGLVLSELPSGRSQVIGHRQIAEHQGTTALCLLDERTVLGGTSVESPGGAPVRARDATAYVFDVRARRLIRSFVPRPGVRTWSGAARCPDGSVHLVSVDGTHLLVDPEKGSTVRELGSVDVGDLAPGGCLVDSETMWLIAERGITRVDLTRHRVDLIARSPWPLTAGGALVGADLYAGSGSHLLRFDGVR